MPRVPNVKWAENSERLFVTVEIYGQEKEAKINYDEKENRLHVEAGEYVLDCELRGKIKLEGSTWGYVGRAVLFNMCKEEKGYWNKLLPDSMGKPVWLGVDWSRWVDEDEEDESSVLNNPVLNGDMPFDMSSILNQQLGLDADADVTDDEDEDEEMPPLEKS